MPTSKASPLTPPLTGAARSMRHEPHPRIHNVRDHVRRVLDALEGRRVTGDLEDQQLTHIAGEESENQRVLTDCLANSQGDESRLLRVARDHDRFLLDVLDGTQVDPGRSSGIPLLYKTSSSTGGTSRDPMT